MIKGATSRGFLAQTILGWVVQKPVNANLGLKVNQGFCFSCYKAFALLILSSSLKEVKVEFYDEKNLQESTSFSYQTEFKIDANPGLA